MLDTNRKKELLAEEPDHLCNWAYVEGKRLGEDYFDHDTTTVAELFSVGRKEYMRSMLELEAEDLVEDGEQFGTYNKVVSHLTAHLYVGGLFRRHLVHGGAAYGVEGMKDFEQGFLDAVRNECKPVNAAIDDRLATFQAANPGKFPPMI